MSEVTLYDLPIKSQTFRTQLILGPTRGEKMLYSGTDPESYITEYASLYEDKFGNVTSQIWGGRVTRRP